MDWGADWDGVEWIGVEWSGVVWSGVGWCGVGYCGVECNVKCIAVEWSRVECGGNLVFLSPISTPPVIDDRTHCVDSIFIATAGLTWCLVS